MYDADMFNYAIGRTVQMHMHLEQNKVRILV
jgi:hypothetical protein